MARTAGDVWRELQLLAPRAEPALLWRLLNQGWQRLGDWRNWSHLRVQDDLVLKAARTGTCGVTQYSAVVTPGTLTFSSADVGRQFRVGTTGFPIVIAELQGANIRLSHAYNDTTNAAASGQILDAFWVAPENFGHFIRWSVIDPVNQWIIRTNVQEATLNRLDPGRTGSGDLRVLAALSAHDVVGALDGRFAYEAWPYQTTAKRFPMLYYARHTELVPNEPFAGVFRTRTDVVLQAALWWMAMWPGDGETKNPWHDLGKATALRAMLEGDGSRPGLLEELSGKDDDIYLTSIVAPGMDRWRWAPLDANWAAERDVMALPTPFGYGYY